MNVEPENSPQSPGDDPLDQLLNEARWPPPTPMAEARLAERWRETWSAQCQHERLVRRAAVVGVAASLLAAATLGWSWLHRGGNSVAPPETARNSVPAIDRGNAAPAAKESRLPRTALRPISASPVTEEIARSSSRTVSPAEGAEERLLSRPPNKVEEMLLAAAMHGEEGREEGREEDREQGSSGRSSPEPTAERKDNRAALGTNPPRRTATADAKQDPAQAAVGRLLADPKADPALAAAPLRSAPLENEGRLLSILAGARMAEQIAALRLLGEIGSSAAVPDLLRAGSDPNLHAAAIGALSRIADSATISQLMREETNSGLERVLLSALLGRGDGDALGLYLSYVVSDSTAPTALAAVELVPNPPMEMLFAALHSTSELERLAAARVLGRIDGPATTERLIALVEEGPSRQEACVALLSSRGQEAVNFVTSARANPALSTLLQAANVLARDKSASDNSQPRS